MTWASAAAVSDRPLEVHPEGLAGSLRWGSQTIRASPKQGVKGPIATADPGAADPRKRRRMIS
jgi:hypothetical protein